MAKAAPASKSKANKKVSDPLDEDRSEGPDPRDPRAKGSPCYGNHKVAKAYKGSVSGSNQYGSWTGCEVCKLRLSYTPRMGCHGIHRKSAPLAADVKAIHEDLPENPEAYPSNREISLTAAENSALQRLEQLRRLRQGSSTTKEIKGKSDKTPKEHQKFQDQSDKTTKEQQKFQDQSDKTTKEQQKFQDQSVEGVVSSASAVSSPVSPHTVLVDPEELPVHHSRKASRPSTMLTEDLERED